VLDIHAHSQSYGLQKSWRILVPSARELLARVFAFLVWVMVPSLCSSLRSSSNVSMKVTLYSRPTYCHVLARPRLTYTSNHHHRPFDPSPPHTQPCLPTTSTLYHYERSITSYHDTRAPYQTNYATLTRPVMGSFPTRMRSAHSPSISRMLRSRRLWNGNCTSNLLGHLA
jgi:hypothetical protein